MLGLGFEGKKSVFSQEPTAPSGDSQYKSAIDCPAEKNQSAHTDPFPHAVSRFPLLLVGINPWI
ncbi:MAG TPA: hypothetical protein DIT67_06920 [Octadecabacter sp.]|nr:hypothetical protein [Octadecabacter sp.]